MQGPFWAGDVLRKQDLLIVHPHHCWQSAAALPANAGHTNAEHASGFPSDLTAKTVV
jgi:hypothetical protein